MISSYQPCYRLLMTMSLFTMLAERKLSHRSYLSFMLLWPQETTMQRPIWENFLKWPLAIGLHFQQQYHLLASVLTLSQVPKGQVLHPSITFLIFKILVEHIEIVLYSIYMLRFCCSIFAAGASERETVYISDGNQNHTIKVGQGNLKLVYSGKDGKLKKYINKRSLVCFYLETWLYFHFSYEFSLYVSQPQYAWFWWFL